MEYSSNLIRTSDLRVSQRQSFLRSGPYAPPTAPRCCKFHRLSETFIRSEFERALITPFRLSDSREPEFSAGILEFVAWGMQNEWKEYSSNLIRTSDLRNIRWRNMCDITRALPTAPYCCTFRRLSPVLTLCKEWFRTSKIRPFRSGSREFEAGDCIGTRYSMLQAKIINIARTIQQKAARSKKWEKNHGI